MAEQLLLSGIIDESYLRARDMIQARVDIGVTLLCHSGMCIVDIHVYLCTHLVYYAYLCIHLVDMKDRCVMCGAGV